ncbi:MAG: hypothetical protein AAF449_08480 [Myxococcota bacterium]
MGWNPENYAHEEDFRSTAVLRDDDILVPIQDSAAAIEPGHVALLTGMPLADLQTLAATGKMQALRFFGCWGPAFEQDGGIRLFELLNEHASELLGVYMPTTNFTDEAVQRFEDPQLLPKLRVFEAINVPVSESAVGTLMQKRPDVIWRFGPRHLIRWVEA